MTRATRTLAAIHLGGDGLLLLLGYYWLGIGESRTISLLWGALVVLVMVALACWLHGATFAYFGADGEVAAAFRRALRNLLPIFVAGLLVLGLYLLLAWWANYSTQPAFSISSWLTLKLRKPVRPNSVYRIFRIVTWIVRWIVLPVLVLPLIAAVSSQGWLGFRKGLARKRMYWLQAPVLLLCALWIPFLLLDWVPHVGSFTVEMISFVVRLLVAYLLFVGAWLLLAFLTSGGKPALSHSSTLVKP